MAPQEVLTQGNAEGGEAKATYVRAMFARIAPRYDLLNTLLTAGQDRRWRQEAARLLARPGAMVLDVATGTGELARALQQQGGWVVGVDFCLPMMQRGQTRGWDGVPVSLVLGDALDLPFADNSFDGAISGFALRNVADLGTFFAELKRVVRPGGRVVSLELTPPGRTLGSRLFRGYFNRVVPTLGGLLSGDGEAYRYLARSLKTFPTAEEVALIMESAGLRTVRHRRYSMGAVAIHVGTKE